MRIKEKIKLGYDGLIEHGPINIVVFGDSVTHGAVGAGEICYDTVYWERLRQKILSVRNYVPVNVINAGIGGITATGSLGRMDRQVLAHNPDLIVVCFGLNDVNDPREQFMASLREIFEKALNSGAEVIFMTPNMLNTRVAEDTEAQYAEYAVKTAEMQNGGRMDACMQAAVALAKECGVTVCDCYAQWKKLSETEDITCLLANRINHPTREMHELFAESLFQAIFDEPTEAQTADSTMYRE